MQNTIDLDISKQFGIFTSLNTIDQDYMNMWKKKLIKWCKRHIANTLQYQTFNSCYKVYKAYVESLPADAKVTPDQMTKKAMEINC